MVAKKKASKVTLITRPAVVLILDGVEYRTGDTVPGEFPRLGEVKNAAKSKGDSEAVETVRD